MLITKEFDTVMFLQSERASSFRGLKMMYCRFDRFRFANFDITTGYNSGVYTHGVLEDNLLIIKRK